VLILVSLGFGFDYTVFPCNLIKLLLALCLLGGSVDGDLYGLIVCNHSLLVFQS
jgi:hypothetical protein